MIGDKEANSDKLPVRVRGSRVQKEMGIKELEMEVLEKVGNMPKAPMSLSMLLSKRPIFR